MQRRNFIQASAIAASVGAVSGCLGEDDTEFPSFAMPAYSSWIPGREADTEILFTHLDWEAVTDLDDQAGDPADENEFGVIDTAPILGVPLYGGAVTPLAVFGILLYPFADVILSVDGEATEGVDTEAMTWAETVVVFHGEYDPAVFETAYTDGFEATEERNGFTVYTGSEEFTDEMAYALSEETLVVGMLPGEDDTYSPAAELDAALDRRLDAVDQLIEQTDGAWLFETTGEAAMSFGVWNTDDLLAAIEVETPDDDTALGGDNAESGPDVDERPVFEDVESVLNTLSFAVEDGEMIDLEARFAALYPADSVPSEQEVVDQLIGDEELPHEVSIDDTRVHATARFEERG